jgi:CRISPR/Cas system CMR-associated protein Cmr3 (group 5 of RAMP superfamily)
MTWKKNNEKFQILYTHIFTSQNLLVTTKHMYVGYDDKTTEVVWVTKFPGIKTQNVLNWKAHNEYIKHKPNSA